VFVELQSQQKIHALQYATTSASARISKGHGYQVFLRKRAGSSFGQKRARNLRRTRKNLKNGQNFTE
jgi:hypothetical protein